MIANKFSPSVAAGKRPINQQKRKEYDQKQALLLAIHEQEKLAWMKKMQKLELEKQKRLKLQNELKKNVIKKVKINRKACLNFQRKYAVTKAAEVIKLFEETAKNDPSINIIKLRKVILGNLVEKHSDKGDQDYWSMQLLIKLGLAPDPDAVEEQNIDSEFTG